METERKKTSKQIKDEVTRPIMIYSGIKLSSGHKELILLTTFTTGHVAKRRKEWSMSYKYEIFIVENSIIWYILMYA